MLVTENRLRTSSLELICMVMYGNKFSGGKIDVLYCWRNGAKFTRFLFIHIHGCYCYSRIYLFVHIQLSLHSRSIFTNVFTHIYGMYRSHSTAYIRSHSRSKYSFSTVQYSFNIFCVLPLHIVRSQLPAAPSEPSLGQCLFCY